jgi:beta-glucosidase
MKFPEGFIWGAATAALQIEGAAAADGKGQSIWDSFCEVPGVIADGSTPEQATDHYRLFAKDIELMAEMGIKAYRFSISWPRILPDGVGTINEAGLVFYEKLVDALLANGIEPWVTLFHWDYPQALIDKGGWLNAASSDWFNEYVKIVVKRLSNRVSHWITLNEPQVFIEFGHRTGIHAPGLKLEFAEVLQVCHNTLLAQGKAVESIRNIAIKKPVVGMAPAGIIGVPAHETEENIQAARLATFRIEKDSCWNNIWFADPAILGHYPEEGLKIYHDIMPDYSRADMEQICQPLDFIGTNIYTADLIVADNSEQKFKTLPFPPGYPVTAMDWPLVPESLYWGVRFFNERYQLPVVITENGMAGHDWLSLDQRVHDQYRIDYISRYLMQLSRACAEGYQCPGYFYWSLLDNFEWAFGYSRRFGLIYVDYSTFKRTMKDSARWYASLIRSGAALVGQD